MIEHDSDFLLFASGEPAQAQDELYLVVGVRQRHSRHLRDEIVAVNQVRHMSNLRFTLER